MFATCLNSVHGYINSYTFISVQIWQWSSLKMFEIKWFRMKRVWSCDVTGFYWCGRYCIIGSEASHSFPSPFAALLIALFFISHHLCCLCFSPLPPYVCSVLHLDLVYITYTFLFTLHHPVTWSLSLSFSLFFHVCLSQLFLSFSYKYK